jgi:hypothetical protein
MRGQNLLRIIMAQRSAVHTDANNQWAGHLEFKHVKSHSEHPLNDHADSLAKRGADNEQCFEGVHEQIVRMNHSNTSVRFGGGKVVAVRYPETVKLGARIDVYGRIVGMDGRQYLVQWYIDGVQEGCIYVHAGSEIEKLGNGQRAATRQGNPPFSEEVRIGFPRLTSRDNLAQEAGEEGGSILSPRRRIREFESPNNSQSQEMDDKSAQEGSSKRKK